MSLTQPKRKATTRYVTYPSEMNYSCPLCDSHASYAYSSSGHSYIDFNGYFNDFVRYYECTNPQCPLHSEPFNPAPPQVLPYKRYSLSVWKWIAQEAKIYKEKPKNIRKRIRKKFRISISEGTIRNCIKEIDSFLSHEIDKRTKEILKEQGKILIALDGQKPDDEGNALWLFVDLISNRVLDVKILSTADADTLHDCIENILKTYDVELLGGVSDKQGSIRAMRETYYEDLPWQYCHFHFLQNAWRPMAAKDANLHKRLKKSVHGLYILSASKTSKVNFEGIGKRSVRTVFEKVEKQLRAILKEYTRKFKKLRGITTYENLKQYVPRWS